MFESSTSACAEPWFAPDRLFQFAAGTTPAVSPAPIREGLTPEPFPPWKFREITAACSELEADKSEKITNLVFIVFDDSKPIPINGTRFRKEEKKPGLMSITKQPIPNQR